MKYILILVIAISFSISAMPGEPSMNEPNWNFAPADPSLTVNTKFTVPLKHETRHMSLADVIKKNSKTEFNTTVSDKVVKQILASIK
jgi:hypothetical protein